MSKSLSKFVILRITITLEDVTKLWKQINEKGMTKVAAANKYNVSVQTITRRLKEYEAEQSKKQ